MILPTTSFNFGDIVLLPFPFTDQSHSKKRPAAIVSSSAYHNSYADAIVMAITSQARPLNLIGEVTLVDWKSAGLINPSVIKPVFATVDRSLIIRKLGLLSPQDLLALNSSLFALFS